MFCCRIRAFLENLNPFEDMNETEISNYLYQASLEIEPRGCKAPVKAPRKWPDVKLKSPGIKPRSSLSRHMPHPLPSMSALFTASSQRINALNASSALSLISSSSSASTLGGGGNNNSHGISSMSIQEEGSSMGGLVRCI